MKKAISLMFIALVIFNFTELKAIGFAKNPSSNSKRELIIEETVLQISCYGMNNGSIHLNILGGTAPITVNWSTGDQTHSITELFPGDYIVTVIDRDGDIFHRSYTIVEPSPLTYQFEKTSNLLTCDLDTIYSKIIGEGGTSSYQYKWTYPNGNSSQDSAIYIINEGVYYVEITDGNGCKTDCSDTIFSEGRPEFSVNIINNVSCFNGSDAKATYILNDSSQEFFISWSNGSNGDTLVNAVAGRYTLVITDSTGCSNSKEFNISQPEKLIVNLVGVDNLCYGLENGAALGMVSGGIAPYSYEWSTGQSGQQIYNLPADYYEVTVTDLNGCLAYDDVVISQGNEITIDISLFHVSCFGGSDGDAYAIGHGGAGEFSYQWSTGSVVQGLSNIKAGEYIISVIDKNNCGLSDTARILEPSALEISFEIKSETPPGKNGRIKVSPSGGTPPYNFLWSTGSTSEVITGLQEGTYYLTITDAKNCIKKDSANVIYDPCIFAGSLVSSPVKCYGDSTGSVFIDITVPGDEPYTYLWDDGSTDFFISNKPAGLYAVTVMDNFGCILNLVGEITQFSPIEVDTNIIQPSTANLETGIIELKISGGKSPYRITAEGIDYFTNQNITITELDRGQQTVTISDVNGCTNHISFFLYPRVCNLSAEIIVTKKILCNGDSNGELCLKINNNIGTSSIVWNTGQTISCLTNIGKGIYSAQIFDTIGCSTNVSYNLQDPLRLKKDTVIIKNGSDGQEGKIQVFFQGGTHPFTYEWTKNGQLFASTKDISGLSDGIYRLLITDANNCELIIGPYQIRIIVGNYITKNQSFKIYPNPAYNVLNIEIDASFENKIFNWLIKDLNGMPILKGNYNSSINPFQINLTEIKAGMYILVLEGENSTSQIKLIKT